MYDNKQVVKELKESITYRSKHLQIIEKFKYAVINYFLEKYDAHVRVLTFGDTFGLEKNMTYYTNEFLNGNRDIRLDFKFDIRVLSDFCDEFECEFLHTSCDGDRFIFNFNDVDMSSAFFR